MSHSSLKGKLLIASPALGDQNFVRTVVLIAQHNEQGALGLVLNRPTDLCLADLWSTISSDIEPIKTEACAFLGGPVQKNAVLVLHGHSDLASDAEPVVPGVFLGSDIELLGKLMVREGEDPGNTALRVFCGYSGWGRGQLDHELEQGGWLTVEATREWVFTEEIDRLWQETMSSLGGVYRFLALMPPHPEYN